MRGERRGRGAARTAWLAIFLALPVCALAEGIEIRQPLVIEVDPAGTVVWQVEGGGYPVAVAAAADGRRAVAYRHSRVVRVYDAAGELAREIAMPRPSDVDFVPGGNLLITSTEKGLVEIDGEGRTVWERGDLKDALATERLAGGNTLVCEGGAGRVVEIDAHGKVVWSFDRGMKRPAAVQRTGERLLVADYNRHEVFCVERSGRICGKLPHIGHPEELHVLSDGTFFASVPFAGLIVRAALPHAILDSWRLGGKVDAFAFTPGGNLLLALTPGKKGLVGEDFSPADAAAILASRGRLQPAEGERPAKPDTARGPLVLLVLAAVAAGLVVWRVPRFRRGRALGILAAVGLLAGGGYALRTWPGSTPWDRVSAKTHGKNLILVMFDSLRWDHTSLHGYWRETTPHLARIGAAEGMVFDQYIVQAPWTKPSVASLFTSTHPANHGATSQQHYSHLPDSLVTLAEALQEAGWFTAAFMENPHMGDKKSSKGFEQGFDVYHYFPPAEFQGKQPAHTVTETLKLLDERPPNQPFFFTLFFLNPHYPYHPRELYFGDREAGPSNTGPINEYDAEIVDADAEVNRLVEELRKRGLWESTILLFTSDHGEEFKDHDSTYHGKTLYDCVLRAPLVITGIGARGRFPGQVREIDIMPTLLDYLGVPVDEEMESRMAGRSIRSFLEDGIERTGLVAMSETRFHDDMYQVSRRDASRKVIADLIAGEVEIYDLEVDPGEYNDLSTPESSAAALDEIRGWVRSQWRAEAPRKELNEEMPEAVREQLRALGYLEDE